MKMFNIFAHSRIFLLFVLFILILCQLYVVSVTFHFQLNFYVVEFKVHIYTESEFTYNFLSYTCCVHFEMFPYKLQSHQVITSIL